MAYVWIYFIVSEALKNNRIYNRTKQKIRNILPNNREK